MKNKKNIILVIVGIFLMYGLSANSNVAQGATCVDSDGGKSITFAPNSTTDGTQNISPAFDHCKDRGNTTLVEYVCNSDGTWKVQEHNCANELTGSTCMINKCAVAPIPTPSPANTCTEIEEGGVTPGYRPFYAGTVIHNNRTYSDSCSGNVLTEYYCKSDKTLGTEVKNCNVHDPSATCVNNKCVMLVVNDNRPKVELKVRDAGPFKTGEPITLLYSINKGCVGAECTDRKADSCKISVSGPENEERSVTFANSNLATYNTSRTQYKAGNYIYKLSCTNSSGVSNSEGALAVVVENPTGLVAKIISPKNGTTIKAGEVVNFTGSGVGTGGKYLWYSGMDCSSCGCILLKETSNPSDFSRIFQKGDWASTALVVKDATGRKSTNIEYALLTVSGSTISNRNNIGELPVALNLCGPAGSKDWVHPKYYSDIADNYSGSFCVFGEPDPAQPNFPAMGEGETWICKDQSGNNSQTCYAKRNNNSE